MWLVIRAAVLLSGTLGANLFVPRPTSPFAGGSILLVFMFFSFGLISMVFVLGVQAFNPRSAAVWAKPTWQVNPFSLKQPLQFFHLMGFYMIAAGIAAVGLTLIKQRLGLEPLLPIALGVGILLGIKCCMFLYRRKFCSL